MQAVNRGPSIRGSENIRGSTDIFSTIDSRIYYYVDHTIKCPINTGMQRVVRGLARSLMERAERLCFVKWDFDHGQLCLVDLDDLAHLSRWMGPELTSEDLSCYPVAGSPGVMISANQIADADWLVVPEVTHINLHPAGVTLDVIMAAKHLGLKSAFIFYDATPLRRPELKDMAPKHEEYMQQLLLADLIVPISEWSAADLGAFSRHCELATEKTSSEIVPLPLPGESLPYPRVTSASRGSRKVILSVGSITPHKNQLALVQAFEAFSLRHPGEGWKLVLLGNVDPVVSSKLEDSSRRTPSIEVLTDVSDEDLHRLYKECALTVFPSVLEGFGLPILESLWHGKPCICANFGAMKEVATGGGCLMVDVRDSGEILSALETLAFDLKVFSKLQAEALARPMSRWSDYAKSFIELLDQSSDPANESVTNRFHMASNSMDSEVRYREFCNLSPRPLLSICISTYNRANWLALNLQNLQRFIPVEQDDVELLVCDNTSTDSTPEVVKPYLKRCDFRYYRNPQNVGMLGNLRVTAHHARGRYIWIIGDDDLLKQGSVERVLDVLRKHSDLALVYLNYSYSNEDDPQSIMNLNEFLTESTPIVAPGEDILGSVRRISAESENFFTAIYCLVFRRDHALRAYSQNTEGRPFSTMLTTIPTTYYVLNYMVDEPAYWIGDPQVVINMNVSWLQYAPLWVLERLPEVFECAEKVGVDPKSVDRWRIHLLQHVNHYFREIYENDTYGNIIYFSPSRLISRFKHLEEFRKIVPDLMAVYEVAHLRGSKGADMPTADVFAEFKN